MIESVPRARTAPVAIAAPRSVTILGATGSIGASTIDLLKRNPSRYRVEAVSANRNGRALARIARELDARFAAVADEGAYRDLKEDLGGSSPPRADRSAPGRSTQSARPRPPRRSSIRIGRWDPRSPSIPPR